MNLAATAGFSVFRQNADTFHISGISNFCHMRFVAFAQDGNFF